MDDFDVLNTSGSEDDEGAGERVRMIMEEIYKNQDKIKSEQDIEEMAERCTNMMMQMRNEAAGKKKEKKPHKVTAGGDKASPPASRASLKESPTKDSGKGAGYSPRQTTLKTALKEFEGKKKASKPVPNFTDLYKEKMEKLRVPGKGELKGLTKTDSTKKESTKRNRKMTNIKLNNEYFNERILKMKEDGVRIKGKEGEPPLERFIKTINNPSESNGDSSASSVHASDSDDDVITPQEKKKVEDMVKKLEGKKEPYRTYKSFSDLRKEYASILDKPKPPSPKKCFFAHKDDKTQKDGGGPLKVIREGADGLPQDEYELSSSDSDRDDPFSSTKEGKDIVKRMKELLEAKKSSFRPSLEAMDVRKLEPEKRILWDKVAEAQADSKLTAASGWQGTKVVDVDSMWLQDIRKANRV